MYDISLYVDAATRANAWRSYRSAIRHFEVEWGGFLPASADAIARCLADHAAVLSVNTLKARLAALAQWHQTQGFPAPTKTPHVRKVLKGIATLHPATEKRAKPLQLVQLDIWRHGSMRRSRTQRRPVTGKPVLRIRVTARSCCSASGAAFTPTNSANCISNTLQSSVAEA
jgi:hypothetical protein